MSDDERKLPADFQAKLDQVRTSMGHLADLCVEQARQLAADMGEAPNDANRMYWGTMGNLLSFGGSRLNSGSSELRALHALACSVPKRSAPQWREANRQCEELFEMIDGGETLAFMDGGTHYYPADSLDQRDWDDETQVADAMTISAEFFHVPSLYRGAVGDVVNAIMRVMDTGWRKLPQPWADAYCYVVACICARVGAAP